MTEFDFKHEWLNAALHLMLTIIALCEHGHVRLNNPFRILIHKLKYTTLCQH